MEEFKVGDIVKTNAVGVTPEGAHHEPVDGGSGFKPNTILTINEITRVGGNLKIYWFKETLNGIYEGNFKHYRKSIKLRKI